jgi:predicted nucleic acid-binding protein
LVAWFCPKDEHHAWAKKVFDELPTGALGCEAVLAETCHLVGKDGVAPAKVLQLVEENSLTLVSLAGEISRIRDLLTRYADVPMDFADACVVRLAELHPTASVCTVDGDFRVFRRLGREPIPMTAPFC